jgi:hypothetical protein
MTTIAYRDGIMAADSRAYSGDRRPMGFKTKIKRLANGGMMASSSIHPGNSELLFSLIDKNGIDHVFTEKLDAQSLVVLPGGDVFYYAGHSRFSGPLSGQYFAIGSGEDYAMGAMAMGATAIQAVDAAKQHDVFSGGPTMVMTVDLSPEVRTTEPLLPGIIDPPTTAPHDPDVTFVASASS